jgi:hypothetical protein
MPAFRFERSIPAAVSALAFGVALAVLVQPGSSLAYTPEQQQACSPDAMRLCGEFVPNVDAITACMIQRKAQLSPECKVYFRPDPEPVTARAGKPTNIKPAAAKKTTKPKPAKKKSSEN